MMNNQDIKTDEDLLKVFRQEFDKDKDIVIKLQGYLNTYGEIIQLYQSYGENPEMTIQKIAKLLKNSSVKIFKEEKLHLFTFNMNYKNQKGQEVETKISELDELRNKIMLSSTNTTNVLKGNNEEEDNIISKERITRDFVNLIDSIKQLNKTLNSLLKSGYPDIINFSLKVKNSHAYDENDETHKYVRLRAVSAKYFNTGYLCTFDLRGIGRRIFFKKRIRLRLFSVASSVFSRLSGISNKWKIPQKI